MAIRRRRSRSSIGGGQVLAWLGAVLALGVLVVAGLGLAKLRTERAGMNANTLCGSQEPGEIITLLFDSSDQLNDLQQIKVRQILDSILYNIPKGARVDVYMATAEAGQLARPLFSRCNPANADGSAGFSENPQRLEEMRQQKFVAPLGEALQKALKANPRRTSPILETIAATSVQSFSRADRRGAGGVRRYSMIIVSDFLQNSAILTHYKSYPNVEEFSKTPGWISTLPRLNGVALKLIYINRPNSRRFQNEAHRNWWCEYFNRHGAISCTIDQL
ncbi:MAG: hypothetical protein COA84_06530 [Robiginitomaculum sp.]|nr:MAG: hypothetical protein COA84_06530 [Robiginitomaculum sp.]